MVTGGLAMSEFAEGMELKCGCFANLTSKELTVICSVHRSGEIQNEDLIKYKKWWSDCQKDKDGYETFLLDLMHKIRKMGI